MYDCVSHIALLFLVCTKHAIRSMLLRQGINYLKTIIKSLMFWYQRNEISEISSLSLPCTLPLLTDGGQHCILEGIKF